MAVKDLAEVRKARKGFDLADVLAGATVEKSSKASGKTPVVTVDEGTQVQISRFCEIVRQMDSLKAEKDLLQAELIEVFTPKHIEACKTGFINSIKAAGTDGHFVTASWEHKYTNVEMSSAPTLEEICGEEFDTYFAADMEIKTRSNDEETLREIISAVTPERFAALFEVKRWLYPTRAYTEQKHTFSEKVRMALQGIVRQYKPSFKTK